MKSLGSGGFVFVFAAAACVAAFAGNSVSTPDALDAARQDALDIIEAGNRPAAVHLLLETLRAIPPDKPELAAPAIGVIQLLLFTNEYLMSNEECAALYKGVFVPDLEKNPEVLAEQAMDRFIMLLMRYTDDAGMTQKEVDTSFLELVRLSHCSHKAVRLGALFMLSDPYYFHENDIIQQSADRIIAEFPGEYLAQEAQRLTLYTYRQYGTEGMAAALNKPGLEGKPNAHMQRVQAGPLGQAIGAAMRAADSGERDAQCAMKLAQAAAQAPTWPEEYAAINVLAGFHESPEAPKAREAAAQSIARARDPRVVFRARVIRMGIANNLNDTAAMLEDADALLKTADVPAVPDRNLYEDLKNGIQQAADKLAAVGQTEQAAGILERLAARFPNTLLATQMQKKIEEMRAAETPPAK